MAKKLTKTNAMRILDSAKFNYVVHEYETDGSLAASDVADYFNEPHAKVFKTLVTTDNNHNYFVFCIPSNAELDLKKAAKVANVKKIEMLKQKDLLGLTGYVHGGCSPVGMKKVFPTFMETSANDFETIYVSGGKIGLQIEINPNDLVSLIKLQFNNIIKD